MLFEGFARERIAGDGVSLLVRHGSAGPPLLLLHGYPQSHVCWHAVAPRLAERFTVVCPDLRGYGGSDKPPGDEAHTHYAKRTMARDVLAVMRALGHERFAVAGHDRGAVVAYRLALDAPEAVARLAVMSVLPVPEQWDALRGVAGLAAYHLFLLAQPPDLPERLIGADPELVLTSTLDGWCRTPGAIVAAAREAYRVAFRNPRTIHAICEDYRANASVDLDLDRADRDAGRRIAAPTLVLWEEPGGVAPPFDPVAVWRRWADDVRGEALDCGHFLPEERPAEVATRLGEFFAESV